MAVETLEEKYKNILACFRSGQMTVAQFYLHLEDRGFAEWYRQLDDVKQPIGKTIEWPKSTYCVKCDTVHDKIVPLGECAKEI